MAAAVEERYGGVVPSRLDDLVTLPGVGRKTANVVRSVAFDLPGLPVDTHVGRLSRRLALTEHEDPVKVELELNSYLPPAERGRFSLRMILHGRRVCLARSPRCAACVLEDICPSSRLPTQAPAATCDRRSQHRAEMFRPSGESCYHRCHQPGSRHLGCRDAGIRRLASPERRPLHEAVVHVVAGFARTMRALIAPNPRIGRSRATRRP